MSVVATTRIVDAAAQHADMAQQPRQGHLRGAMLPQLTWSQPDLDPTRLRAHYVRKL